MTTRYTKEHEWVRLEGGIAVIGISVYAQEQLGDVVFVELPETGKDLAKGDEAAVVESVKAASEVYAPISGKVVAVNDALEGEPGLVNQSPETTGWFFKIEPKDKSEVESLMDESAYASFLETI